MSESSSAIKPLSVKRRCRTFGGGNGVWWRHRRRPQTTTPSPSPPQSPFKIEWDEDLCRPIYRSKTPTEEGSVVVSDGNDASPESSPTPSSPKDESSSTLQSLWTNAPVKRNKSFATQKRPYSVLLLESSSSNHSSPSSSQGEDAQSHASNASTTLSFSKNANNNNDKPIKRKRRVLAKDEAVLQKAKQFFEQLDATHALKISASPTTQQSSKITRTSYKLNLNSPRIQKEYQAYSKASKESGVSPYSIQTYAASRREFFRKRELFDGFLDD